MLELEQKTYWILDDNEFDSIVDNVIGYIESNDYRYSGYSFISSQEANNYSAYTMGMITKTDFFKYSWSLTEVNKWLTYFHTTGKVRDCNPYDVLCALVAAEVLPEGNYLIKVSW